MTDAERLEWTAERDKTAQLSDILQTITPYLYETGKEWPAPLLRVELKKRLAAIDKALRAAKIPRFDMGEEMKRMEKESEALYYD